MNCPFLGIRLGSVLARFDVGVLARRCDGPRLSAGRGRGRRQAGWDRCAGLSSRPRPRSWPRRARADRAFRFRHRRHHPRRWDSPDQSGRGAPGQQRPDVSHDPRHAQGTRRAPRPPHRAAITGPARGWAEPRGSGHIAGTTAIQTACENRPLPTPARSAPGWRAAAGIRPVSALDPVHRVSRRVGIRWAVAVAVAGCLFSAARKGPSADQSCVHIGGSWLAFAFTVSDLHAGILVPGQAAAVSR